MSVGFMFLILLNFNEASAQLKIQVRNFINNPLVSANCEIELKVTQNDNPIILDKENILFQELNFISKTLSATTLNDGWQKVVWVPNHDKILTNPDDEGLVDYVGKVIVSYEGEVASLDLLKGDINTPKISVLSNTANRANIFELFFGGRAIGDSAVIQVNVRAERLAMNNLQLAYPVRVDSITTSGEGFSYYWQGSQATGTLRAVPPFDINGVGDNLVDVIFKPTSNKYYNEILTIHYNSGAKRYIKLFGNSYNIDYQSRFKLLYPNGGEKLAPCEEIDIRWTGHTIGRPNYIEISFDGGSRWFEVGNTLDSVFRYKLPNIKGERTRIRVFQKYDQSTPFAMEQNIQINNIDFKSNGRRLAYPKNNSIVEWDVASSTPTQVKTYGLNISGGVLIRDVKYHNFQNINFIALYNTQNVMFGTRGRDTIAIFDEMSSTPIEKYGFPDYYVKSITPNPNSSLLYLVPLTANKVNIFSLETKTSIFKYTFPIPVTTISVNEIDNEIIITFLNGDIHVYNRTDFNAGNLTFVRSIVIPDVPIIKDCIISPNGKFMTLSFEYDDASLFKDLNQSMLIDYKTGEIINIFKKTYTQTVGFSFSPESNLLILGHAGTPQIVLHDLIKRTDDDLYVGPSQLTKLKFSPQGNAFAATTTGSNGVSVSYRTINFPLTDVSDSLFSIEVPKNTKITADFGSELIFTSKSKTVENVICNNSTTKFFFDEVRLKEGKHFKINNNLVPDTLGIGECKDIDLVFTPQDTGVVIDTLILVSCSNEIYIELKGFGLNRNVKFVQSPVTISEKCIGEFHILELVLFENMDNEPLLVSGFEFESQPNFIIEKLYPQNDTTIAPNGKLKVVFRYRIDTLGNFTQKFKVLHNNQNKYYFENQIKVKGIGTYIDLSHKILPFVLEDTKRIITIQNLSLQSVFIDDFIITGSNAFTITSAKNIEIKPNETANIEVSWNGDDFTEANLFINANPCLVQNNIRIVKYIGTSLVTIGNTTSEPTKDGFVLLTMKNTENFPYKGTRNFTATLNLDYQVFFPERIESKYNNLTLTRNPILNGDRREFTISASGDFEIEGELMKIWGKPGLSDEDSTNIQIISSDYFGKSVDETYRPGNFKVINICGDRRLLDLNINEIKYYPNPTNNILNISIYSNITQNVSVSLFTNNGILLHKFEKSLEKEDNNIMVDMTNYEQGTYNVIIENNNNYYPINIIKTK